MKKKSPASIFFLVIGVIMIIMALKVFEWGGSLDQNPLAIIAIFGTLGLLALGAISIFTSTYFKTMSGLAIEDNHDQQEDSNDDGKGAEDARTTSRVGKRLVKRFIVIVQLGVLVFFIGGTNPDRHPILLFFLIIAAGALIWRAWKWERSERKIHGAENPVQRHLRAQARRRRH